MRRPPLPEPRLGFSRSGFLSALFHLPARAGHRRLRRAAATVCWAAGFGLGCGPSEDGPQPSVPSSHSADRESWEAVIEMRGPTFWATLRAPYLQDFADERITRADRGAEISFLDSAGTVVTRLTADTMVLEQRTDRLAMGGSVVIRAGDSLVARSDSLVWNREQDLVVIPRIVDVVLPSGTMRGRNLVTASRFDRWTAQDIRVQWQAAVNGDEINGDEPDSDHDVFDFELSARREDSQWLEGQLVARYDTVSARVEGNRIRSLKAVFSEADGRILFSSGVEIEDGQRFIRADEVEYKLQGKRGEARARGSVEVEEEDGQRLVAEEMTYGEDGERWSARGRPASLTMAQVPMAQAPMAQAPMPRARSLEADRVRYEREEDAFFAAPRTVFRDGDRVLKADSLIFFRGEDRLEAVGNVDLRAPEFRGVATASTAIFDLVAEEVQLGGSPHLLRARDSGDSLILRATELSFKLGAERISGSGGFYLAAGDLVLTARAGGFDFAAQQAEFVGDVEFVQETPGTGGISRIHADSMALGLSEGGEVESVDLPGGLSGTIRTGGAGASWIRASRGSILLVSERLSRLQLDGDADVTYRNSATESVSRFQGRAMSLNFDEEGSLVGVTAEGGATVVSRLPGGGREALNQSAGTADQSAGTADQSAGAAATRGQRSEGAAPGIEGGADRTEATMNTVKGERLEILLQDGEVIEVRVIESIEGTFAPPEARE